MPQYTIKLEKQEVKNLESIIQKGKHSAQDFRTAYILLACDKGEHSKDKKITNNVICKILRIDECTITRIKKKFIKEGFDAVLQRRPSSQSYKRKFDKDLLAKLIALCDSMPPDNLRKWSYRRLESKMIELGYVKSISHATIWNVLKKMNVSLEYKR